MNELSMLHMTQPTSGGAVMEVTNCCANCVEISRPLPMGTRFTVFGQAGHAYPQLHTNKSGFAISVINKYMVGSIC